MPRVLPAIAACAITLCVATAALAQRTPEPRPADVTAPPLIRIDNPDARGLAPIRLQSADVAVDVAGRLARTTLTLVLHNPNARDLEGTLEFPLQAGQQVTGFALDIDGAMREAVPVPKEKGREVFESIERRNVDPGLLEQTAGQHFRLRVYPVPANGERRVQLVIDETMRRDGDAARLDVPVHLLSGAGAFSLQVRGARAPEVVGTFDRLRFTRRDGAFVATVPRDGFRATTPLGLRFPTRNGPAAYAATTPDGERYVLAEAPEPPAADAQRAMPHSVGLLWDASASARNRDRDAEFALLDRYFRAMGNGRVTLRVLRDVGEDGGTFEVRAGAWAALRTALSTLVLDGASDLADWTPRADIEEYLLVSDGLRNYGDGAFPRLSATQRLYALDTAGAAADGVRLATLAQQRNGRHIAWRGQGGVDAAARALLQSGTRIVGLAPHGVTDLEVPGRFVEDGVLRIAGRATEPDAHVDVTLESQGQRRTVRVAMPTDDATHPQVAALWAGWRVNALSADPDANRAQVARLGQRFGVVTPGTSLLVLEDPADYVRYDIPAPAALRAQVEALAQDMRTVKATLRTSRIEAAASAFAERIAWWETKFPLPGAAKIAEADAVPAMAVAQAADAADAAVAAATSAEQRADGERARAERAAVAPRAAPAPAEPAPAALQYAAPPPPPSASLDSVEVQGGASPAATIVLQPWAPDSPYARRLRDAAPDALYAVYLDERDSHAGSTAFLLDVADLLLKKGRRAEGLRVLSNLAEMQLESRHVLRVLGYRLMQAGEHARAVSVLRQVLALADEEPQSHRDLGLALAAAGDRQGAIAHLYDVVARDWDARFAEVDMIALNELNAIVATSPTRLDTAFVDRRLLRNLPVELRVVLGWDSDNSDMDLWVTGPDGEKCFYGHRGTREGGRLSDDFTGGYGPEEFLLRNARPGRYRVQAHFFGERQQVVTGATTLSLRLSTAWGTRKQKDQAVVLRLSGKDDTVLVGEFEVE